MVVCKCVYIYVMYHLYHYIRFPCLCNLFITTTATSTFCTPLNETAEPINGGFDSRLVTLCLDLCIEKLTSIILHRYSTSRSCCRDQTDAACKGYEANSPNPFPHDCTPCFRRFVFLCLALLVFDGFLIPLMVSDLVPFIVPDSHAVIVAVPAPTGVP